MGWYTCTMDQHLWSPSTIFWPIAILSSLLSEMKQTLKTICVVFPEFSPKPLIISVSSFQHDICGDVVLRHFRTRPEAGGQAMCSQSHWESQTRPVRVEHLEYPRMTGKSFNLFLLVLSRDLIWGYHYFRKPPHVCLCIPIINHII